MSVVYHGNAGPAIMSPELMRAFELSLGKLKRQKGSRNLLFNEKFVNRKKKWNRWTGEQFNLTRKVLQNFKRNNKTANKNKSYNTNNSNNNNNINNNINTNNLKNVNITGPNWKLSVGNNYETIPAALRPTRKVRRFIVNN